MVRIVLAAIVGGFLRFVWGAFSHTVLPFEREALRPIPNESAVLSTFGSNLSAPGMYFFPGIDMSGKVPAAEQEAWNQKLASGPSRECGAGAREQHQQERYQDQHRRKD